MRGFLEFVVGQLVDLPESIGVHEEDRGTEVHFTLILPPSEIGKVIGKQGHTIQAIRNLLSTAATREEKRVFLEISERAE